MFKQQFKKVGPSVIELNLVSRQFNDFLFFFSLSETSSRPNMLYVALDYLSSIIITWLIRKVFLSRPVRPPSEIMHSNGSTLSPVEPCRPLCRNSDEIRDVSRIIR